MNKLWGLLSICQKAGAVASGEFAAMEAIKSGNAFLVFLASDASENTKKRFNDKAKYRNIPVKEIGNRQELGHAIGKEFRTSVAITDQGFAESLLKKMEENK